MNLQQIKENIHITDYLKSKGILPKKQSGEDFWYCSPLRQETHPSFKVNNRINCWFDYGLNRGGNLIELVMLLHNFQTLSEVIWHLTLNTPVPFYRFSSFEQQKICSGITEIKAGSLTHQALCQYLQERKIDLVTAKRYCKEIHFRSGGKHYFAIGFPNNGGGYELRNKYFKGCTSKDISTFENRYDTCIVFEGFMDYLSYLTLKQIQAPDSDTLVLNSVINLSKAEAYLKTHENIHCYLDNDEAGKRALSDIRKLGKEVKDCSENYNTYKDLNEYLVRNNIRVKEQNKRKSGLKL